MKRRVIFLYLMKISEMTETDKKYIEAAKEHKKAVAHWCRTGDGSFMNKTNEVLCGYEREGKLTIKISWRESSADKIIYKKKPWVKNLLKKILA